MRPRWRYRAYAHHPDNTVTLIAGGSKEFCRVSMLRWIDNGIDKDDVVVLAEVLEQMSGDRE